MLLCFTRAGFALLPQSFGKLRDAPLNALEDCLIKMRVRAIGIGHKPVLDFFVDRKRELARSSAHVYDDIGGTKILFADALGFQVLDGISILGESFGGKAGKKTERRQAGAGRVDDIGGIVASNGFGHRAATRIAKAHKQNLRSNGFFARIFRRLLFFHFGDFRLLTSRGGFAATSLRK